LIVDGGVRIVSDELQQSTEAGSVEAGSRPRTLDARGLIRPMILMAALLLVPIIPFILFGESFEASIREWLARDWPVWTRFSLVVAVLSTDILLPVPSSAVSTYAGADLGAIIGALASWMGMSLGAGAGFALARLLGRPFAVRLTGAKDLDHATTLVERFGASAVIATRAVPVFAEACVLLVGVSRMPWRRFLPALLLSNLVISVVYAAFGAYAEEHESLQVAILAAVLLPIAALFVLRQRFVAGQRTASKSAD